MPMDMVERSRITELQPEPRPPRLVPAPAVWPLAVAAQQQLATRLLCCLANQVGLQKRSSEDGVARLRTQLLPDNKARAKKGGLTLAALEERTLLLPDPARCVRKDDRDAVNDRIPGRAARAREEALPYPAPALLKDLRHRQRPVHVSPLDEAPAGWTGQPLMLDELR